MAVPPGGGGRGSWGYGGGWHFNDGQWGHHREPWGSAQVYSSQRENMNVSLWSMLLIANMNNILMGILLTKNVCLWSMLLIENMNKL
jgi:hypothetical protein